MVGDHSSLPAPRVSRSLHASTVDLHTALRREEAITQGLRQEGNVKRKKARESPLSTDLSQDLLTIVSYADKEKHKARGNGLEKVEGSEQGVLTAPHTRQEEAASSTVERPASQFPEFVDSPAFPDEIYATMRPATSLALMNSNIEELLPKNSARRHATRTPDILWQEKRFLKQYRNRLEKLPTGARASLQIESEAVRVFGDYEDSANKFMKGPGKFIEAHSLEIRLAELLLKARQMLGENPTSETRSKCNMMLGVELFKILDASAAASGPFQNLLQNLSKELRIMTYSTEKSFDQDVQVDLPYIEVVSRLKRDNERMSATLVSATAALGKTEKDAAKLAAAKKSLEKSVMLLEQQLQHKSSDSRGIEEIYKELQDDHAKLQKNFHDLQRGFMMGELQDDLKESLMSGFAQTSDDKAMVEEQSAMQKLVQQLKDAREAMLNSQDDMNYWKGKYDALNEKMNHLQQSFLDAVNSLELAKVKMHGMVPNAVHCALKDRYAKLLSKMGKLTSQYQKVCKKLDVPTAVKQLPPDDWRRYEDETPADQTDLAAASAQDLQEPDLDTPEDEVPPDFVDSVKAFRERLIASYRNYRKVHGVSVVSWMALKNLTLAEFAKLEQDCFSKNSIWALALQRPVDIPESITQPTSEIIVPVESNKAGGHAGAPSGSLRASPSPSFRAGPTPSFKGHPAGPSPSFKAHPAASFKTSASANASFKHVLHAQSFKAGITNSFKVPHAAPKEGKKPEA